MNGVVLEPDGGMVVGTTSGGTPISWTIRKLHADGSLDKGFQETVADALLWPMFRQPTGAILAVDAKGDTIRFAPDGTRDPHFLVPYTTFPIAVQADGGLLYGTDPVVRLTPDGEADPNFSQIDHPRAIACAPDNSIWLLRSGDANEGVYPPLTNGLARLEHLQSDGSPDTNWPSALIELGQRFCTRRSRAGPVGQPAPERIISARERSTAPRGRPVLVNSPGVRFEVAPQSAVVGENSGTNAITILRLGDHTQPVTVNWSLAGASALADVDFKPGSGVLSFAAGEYERSIPLAVIDNNSPDRDRSLRIQLSDAQAKAFPDLEVGIANDDLGFAPGSTRRFSNGRVWLEPTGQTLRTGDVVIEFSDDLQNWEPMNPIGTAQGVLDEPEVFGPARFYRVTGHDARPRMRWGQVTARCEKGPTAS